MAPTSCQKGIFNGSRSYYSLAGPVFPAWHKWPARNVFALDRIGLQAPVSYPSIVFYAVAEICVMHLSGTLNDGEESQSSHNECTKGICSESDNVVGLRE